MISHINLSLVYENDSHVHAAGGAIPRPQRSITVTENNQTATYIELLRGRDGRDGLPGLTGSQGGKGERGERGYRGPAGPPGPSSCGVIYTRWGWTTCPSTPGTELLYAGRTGGTFYTDKGGGSNYLCMPDVPEYVLPHRAGVKDHARIHGAEYQSPVSTSTSSDHNAPCAVCYVTTRKVMVMLPAKATCPPSWTREYYGYLMSGWKGSEGRTRFECVDKDAMSIPGSAADTNGVVFVHVEASCNGLPCPPYDVNKELNCVVCTK